MREILRRQSPYKPVISQKKCHRQKSQRAYFVNIAENEVTGDAYSALNPIMLHCSSNDPPLQSRCKVDANSMQSR